VVKKRAEELNAPEWRRQAKPSPIKKRGRRRPGAGQQTINCNHQLHRIPFRVPQLLGSPVFRVAAVGDTQAGCSKQLPVISAKIKFTLADFKSTLCASSSYLFPG